MIHALSNIIYTQPNIQAAQEYLKNRGVDATQMTYPPVLTSKDAEPFRKLSKFLPPHLFTETIYFPVTDMEDPTKLVGFDARYLGSDSTRLRFRKFKEEGNYLLLYYTKPLFEIHPEEPLIVTEGIVDAETIRPLGFPIISPLTAMRSFKFCCFLKAISNNIYFAYDNDSAGQNAIKQITKEIQITPEFQKTFKVLNFAGKDLNESFLKKGRDYLYTILKAQII